MESGPSLRKRKLREDKKPACDACRANKLRCDAFLDYSRPCSRCLKKQVECVVPAERHKKTSPGESPNAPSMSPQHQHDVASYLVRSSDSLPIQPSLASSSIPAIPHFDTESGGVAPSTSTFEDRLDTASRTLVNVCVEATMIDICFARFDRYYAPLLPILSYKPIPNQTFHESPLKFWVLVAIGSRKCLEDPTLFSALSPHVEMLAMTSLFLDRRSPFPLIEALLLMCTWHLSTDTPYFRSIYCTLSSAAVTLTLQAGMHHCLNLQGVVSQTAVDVARGAKLWAYAVITNQSAMATHGYPINDLLASRHLVRGHECCATLPSWMMLQSRIIAIITRMHRAVSDLELETDPKGHSMTLKSLITAFEADLLDLNGSVESESPLSKLDFAIARLQIRSFAFLTTQSDLDHADLTQLSNAAVLTMDATSELDKTFQISLHCPDYVFHGVMLAACTLLRLLKSYPPKTFSEKDQTRALFSAINICKSISVVNNDIPAKVSEILAGLWSSAKVYRDVDGAYIQSLHVANRLTMSVVYDCLWWWKKLSADWLNEQATQNHTGSPISGQSRNEEETSSFSPSFFDDSWGWGIDWGVIQSLGPQALSFDQSDHSPYNIARG